MYIGKNAHITPVHTQRDRHVKVEQYSAEAESAIILYSGQITTFKGRVSYFFVILP